MAGSFCFRRCCLVQCLRRGSERLMESVHTHRLCACAQGRRGCAVSAAQARGHQHTHGTGDPFGRRKCSLHYTTTASLGSLRLSRKSTFLARSSVCWRLNVCKHLRPRNCLRSSRLRVHLATTPRTLRASAIAVASTRLPVRRPASASLSVPRQQSSLKSSQRFICTGRSATT